jgi:hypothetical protein
MNFDLRVLEEWVKSKTWVICHVSSLDGAAIKNSVRIGPLDEEL